MTSIQFPKKDGVDVRYAVRGLIILLAVIATGLVAYAFLQSFIGYLEIREIGAQYTMIFWQNMRTRLLIGGIAFLLIFGLFYANHCLVLRIITSRDATMRQFQKPLLAFFLSFIFAFSCGWLLSGEIYDSFLTFTNQTTFGYGDSLFNVDVGYYVFARPFLLELISYLSTTWLGLVGYTLIVYGITAARLSVFNRKIRYETAILNHMGGMVAGFILINLLRYRFALEEMLYGTFDGLTGAGYTDLYVWGVYYRIAPYLVIVLLGIAAFFYLKKQFRRVLWTILVFPVCLLATLAAARLTDSLVVKPNAFALQKNSIETNWYLTRRGFDLEYLLTVNDTQVPGFHQDTLQNDPSAVTALNNLKLVDTSAETLAQFKGGEAYYLGNAQYRQLEIDGNPTLIFTASRESASPSQAGMGLVMGYSAQTDAEGKPLLLMEGIPTLTRSTALPELRNDALYFSPQATDALVLSKADYDGKAGIPLTFWNRIAYQLRNHSNTTTTPIKDTDMGLMNRKVSDRLNRLAPFFRYDTPYPIVTDEGNLLWVCEAYAVTDRYPFAQTFDGVNYIRDVATVTIDAYDGTVRFYRNRNEPISDTYQKIYPTLFAAEPLPQSVADQRRAPELLYKLQMQVLEQYHETDLERFYLRQGAWNCAKVSYNGEEAKRMEPTLTWVSLPDAQDQLQRTPVLMTIYTDKSGNNVTAVFLRDSGTWNRDRMVLYVFSEGQTQMTPQAFISSLSTNQEYLMRQATWQAAGLNIACGQVSPVFLNQTLLYAAPIYNVSATGEKRLTAVAMGNGKRVVVRNSVNDCLTALVNAGDVVTSPAENLVDLSDLIDAVILAYDQVREANVQSDWASYGNAMNELESAIRRLESGKNQSSINE